MPPSPVKPRADGLKFRWDVVLLTGFIFAVMKRATMLPAHECIGAAVIPLLGVHLWLNWNWLVDVVQRPFRSLTGEARFNRWWNVVQLVVAVVALGSGLLASRFLLPVLGLPTSRSHFLGDLHAASSYILVGMVGVHLGLHGHWIWSRVRGRSAEAGASTRKAPSRRRWIAAAVALVILAAGLAASRSDLYRHHRSLIVRSERDFALTAALIAVPGAIAFGALVRLRRQRRLG